MRTITFILIMMLFVSCANKTPSFHKNKTCSNESLKYLKNPRNKDKTTILNSKLYNDMTATTGAVQKCYEDYSERSGEQEFNTCLVAGVDDEGNLDFYNLNSREVKLDQKFLDCTKHATKDIPYSRYGKNFILIQTYRFFVMNP